MHSHASAEDMSKARCSNTEPLFLKEVYVVHAINLVEDYATGYHY